MKLGKKNLLAVSFMLFALFFGAGNLIFPPFLGQNAGAQTVPAILGFLVTAVILPVLGVIVVAKFDGLDRLGQKVGSHFALIFTILIYLSIGPGLGIPRAASVPFEMAVAPYLPEGLNLTACRIGYSLVFFLVALWLCLNPNKLVDRIGHVLTPLTLGCLLVLFIGFLLRGEVNVAPPQSAYESRSLMQGFVDGYQTMDTIAALNFGLVIATTLTALGVKEKQGVIRYTVVCGIAAGTILSLVYLALTYMGACSSGVYSIQENGAWTLRCIVYEVYGDWGAYLLAAIFTLACLTTCVGLINSISRYFSTLWSRVSYRQWVFTIVGFSFLVCNMGLSAILSVSVPVLNAIYPVSIVLIVLGLTDRFWQNNPTVYPLVVAGTGIVSVIHALETASVPLDSLYNLARCLPFYDSGFGWVPVGAVMLAVSAAAGLFCKRSAAAEI